MEAESAAGAHYLSSQLITCIGNKRALLPFIEQAVERIEKRLGRSLESGADLFAGSGVVSRLLKGRVDRLISNDLEAYAAAIGNCYLANRSDIDFETLLRRAETLDAQRDRKDLDEGFLTRLYSPRRDHDIRPGERVFYSSENARRLDNLRRLIAEEPPDLQPLLLGPLLSAASVHANTSGVFKGFYKNAATGVGQFGGTGRHALSRILGEIRLVSPVLSPREGEWSMHRGDAAALVREMDAVDLAYIDPPYNQHPYGSNYFMLNLLASYVEPDETQISKVSGIPPDWRRSDYNVRKNAAPAFADLVAHTPADFLLVSYSDEGFISAEDMCAILATRGKVTVLEADYHTFRGSRNLHKRSKSVKERLFLLETR